MKDFPIPFRTGDFLFGFPKPFAAILSRPLRVLEIPVLFSPPSSDFPCRSLFPPNIGQGFPPSTQPRTLSVPPKTCPFPEGLPFFLRCTQVRFFLGDHTPPRCLTLIYLRFLLPFWLELASALFSPPPYTIPFFPNFFLSLPTIRVRRRLRTPFFPFPPTPSFFYVAKAASLPSPNFFRERTGLTPPSTL